MQWMIKSRLEERAALRQAPRGVGQIETGLRAGLFWITGVGVVIIAVGALGLAQALR